MCVTKKSSSRRTFTKNDKTVADEFSQFFSSLGKNTVAKITKLAKESNYTLGQSSFVPRTYPMSEQFTFKAVEYRQVQKVIVSMASGKAVRIDKIPILVIKDCLPAILSPLTSIINATFESDIFLMAWKVAEVIPILKNGDHEIPNNNRPISLLPVCERVAYNQFMSYLFACNRSFNIQTKWQ